MINKKTYILIIATLVAAVTLGYFSYKWYFNYKYAFDGKLITTVSADKLIDKSWIKATKERSWFCDIINSNKLSFIFKDIDLSLFPKDVTILIIYGGKLNPKVNHEYFDRSDLTPRGNQRYVGIRISTCPKLKKIFSLYTYNSKRCMIH
jgi:hypothetical protein